MKKRWKKAEIDYLKRHAGSGPEKLAKHFGTDPESVRRKLEELEAENAETSKAVTDPALKDYDEALGLLYKKQWKKAATIFEKVVAEADSPHLTDRARQNLEVCRQRQRKHEETDDPYLRAVFEKNQGNLDDALKLCEQHGKLDKEERYAYLVASIRALAGDEEEALKHLQAAIRLEPKNRVHAFHDPDFEPLHDSDEFRSLTSESSS